MVNWCVLLSGKIFLLVAQYLPTAQVATTTAAIAVTAASSALLAKPLADLLLKVIKPAVIKKVIAKISKLRGMKVKIESLKERRDLQRERSQAIRTLRRMTKGK